MSTFTPLLTQLQPSRYALTLDLDRTARHFSGSMVMHATVPHQTNSLTLHAKKLSIDTISVNGSRVDKIHLDDDMGEVILTLHEPVSGPVVIEASWDGEITDAMHGVYPCYYTIDGTKHELLATQFESHHAREVFPCIDEPSGKATFDLTLITEPGVTALSNMPVTEQGEHATDKLRTVFDTTPIMSPYLLAFVIGKLHKASATTKTGVEVNVWATAAQSAASLTFSLDTAVRAIEFFDDYFGVPYPLPKSDHVALPDFSSGAMENWGLITYREMCLLVDPDHTSQSVREYVATVVCHELSHQWFGNLVTMKWWDDLWLNESFATLMEYIAVDALYPQWNIWQSFASHEGLAALRRDALPGVQPVKVAVNHPDEISTLFDGAIVYAKGARLLAMMRHYIGDDAFRDGLKNYFKTHQYANTAGRDLWRALEDASGKAVAQLMNSWLEQPGFPLLRVMRPDQADRAKVTITQESFSVADNRAPSPATWPVPLLGSTGSGLEDTLLHYSNTLSIHSDTPVQLNKDATGHYIVRYQSEVDWNAIKDALAKQQLPGAERLMLLSDSMLQARSGVGSIVESFELLANYSQENIEAVWDVMSLVIAEARRVIEGDDEAETALKQRVNQLIATQYDRLGWASNNANEDGGDAKLRATILGLGVYADNPAICAEAKRLFDAAKDDLRTLPAELRGIIMSSVVKRGESDAFGTLLACYRNTSNAELQNDCLSGLSSARDSGEISQLLSYITDESIVRLQDVDRWFVYLLRSRYARDAAWQWMVDNWDWIERNFASDKSFDAYPRYAGNTLATTEWLDRYSSFFNRYKDVPALSRVIDVGKADIASKAAWVTRDAPLLRNYLIG